MSAYDLLRRIDAIEARLAALEKVTKTGSSTREVLAQQYEKRFGKRPHHFLSEDKIMEALGGGR